MMEAMMEARMVTGKTKDNRYYIFGAHNGGIFGRYAKTPQEAAEIITKRMNDHPQTWNLEKVLPEILAYLK